MADNESIGGVSVQITGDASQLNASFTAAQATAQKAGTQVASAFNAGAAGATDFTGAIQALTTAMAEQNAALSLSIQRNMAMAGSFGQASRGARQAVTEIQAVSGTLRTLEGTGGIRAAERFLTLIPGLGAALQVAFPVVGAIALYEAMERTIGRTEQLKQALKELQSQAESTDKADMDLVRTLDRIGAEAIGRQFGGAAQTAAEATNLKQEAQDAGNEILKLQSHIKELNVSIKNNDRWVPFGPSQKEIDAQVAADEEKINQLLDKQQGLYAQAGNAALNAGQKAQQQSGSLRAAIVKDTEEANVRAAEISKQKYSAEIESAHAAEQQRIAGLEREYDRVVQTSAEEIRYEKDKQDEINGYALATRDRTIQEIAARARAESAGKTTPEQALISERARADTSKANDEYTRTTGQSALEVQKAQQAATLKLDELNQRLAQTLRGEVAAGWEKVDAAANKARAISEEATTKDLEIKARVAEIQDKAAGELKALQLQGQKIARENEYGAKVFKNESDRVKLLTDVAAIEAQINAAKLAGLEADLADAQSLAGTLRDETRIATLQAQIAALKQQGANQQIAASGQIAAAQPGKILADQLAKGLKGSLTGLAGSFGSDIVSALFDKHPGKSIGQEIAATFASSAKQALGSLLSQALSSLASFGLGFLGFAGGTDSAPGGLSLVGERGPELVNLPRGAQVIPNHAINRYADGTPGYNRAQSSRTSNAQTNHNTFHIYGVRDARQFARDIPNYIKSTGPGYTVFST